MVTWKCQQCGEEVEDTFDACWNCGTGKDGTPPKDSSAFQEAGTVVKDIGQRLETPSTSRCSGDVAQAVHERYTDVYLVARATTTIGGIVKAIGIILALIIFVVGLVIASQSDGTIGVATMLLAAVAGVPLYVLGILVSAQGQILKAILDTTVTSSPFLAKEQMKKVMSLSE